MVQITAGAPFSRRYPLLTGNSPLAVLLFRLLTYYIPRAMYLACLVFAFIPRHLFSSDGVSLIVMYALSLWPKMAFDHASLATRDLSLANKYVVFNILFAVIVLTALPLLVYFGFLIVHENARAPPGSNLPYNRLCSWILAAGCLVLITIFPNFYPSREYRTGLPYSEVGFFFNAAIWAGLLWFLTILTLRELKFLVEKSSNKPRQ
jgi:hypothetical protein